MKQKYQKPALRLCASEDMIRTSGELFSIGNESSTVSGQSVDWNTDWN